MTDTGQGDVEKVARIIDPRSWSRFDCCYPFAANIPREQGIAWTIELQSSLTRAREIIAALKASALVGDDLQTVATAGTKAELRQFFADHIDPPPPALEAGDLEWLRGHLDKVTLADVRGLGKDRGNARINRILDALKAPEGYILVPVEPSEAMLEAAVIARVDADRPFTDAIKLKDFRLGTAVEIANGDGRLAAVSYLAMLAASPVKASPAPLQGDQLAKLRADLITNARARIAKVIALEEAGTCSRDTLDVARNDRDRALIRLGREALSATGEE